MLCGGHACIRGWLHGGGWHGCPQAALFTRPFIVRGGGEGILNRSAFQRDQMLAFAAHSKLNVVGIGEANTQPILPGWLSSSRLSCCQFLHSRFGLLGNDWDLPYMNEDF